MVQFTAFATVVAVAAVGVLAKDKPVTTDIFLVGFDSQKLVGSVIASVCLSSISGHSGRSVGLLSFNVLTHCRMPAQLPSLSHVPRPRTANSPPPSSSPKALLPCTTYTPTSLPHLTIPRERSKSDV